MIAVDLGHLAVSGKVRTLVVVIALYQLKGEQRNAISLYKGFGNHSTANPSSLSNQTVE